MSGENECPETLINTSEHRGVKFKEDLFIAIKESLHCNWKHDSLVEIRIPVPKDFLDILKSRGTSISGR